MAQAKTPTPVGGYRDEDKICFVWNRNTPPAYNHFDIVWGVFYSGSWDDESGKVIKDAPDPLHYSVHGFNQTGGVENYGNFATSSYAKAFSPNDWYPFQNRICSGMWFKVRGDSAAASENNANNTRSAWSKGKLVQFAKPTKPECTATRSGGTTTFTWNNPDGTNSLKWCSEVQVQTRLGGASWVTIDHNTAIGGATVSGNGWRDTSGSCTVEESATTQAGATSHARRYRARSRGPYGASGWTEVLAWRWAKPNTPTLNAKKSGRSAANDYLSWSYSDKDGKPAEELVVERCIGTPTTSADALPSSPSWTQSETVENPSSGVTGIAIDTVSEDKCVWMRATAYHGDLSTASKAIVTYRGQLKAPSNLAATQTGTDVRLTWTNNTTVPGALVKVSRRGETDTNWVELTRLSGTASGGDTYCDIHYVAEGSVWDYKVEAVKSGWITSEESAVYNLGRPGKPTITSATYYESGNFVNVLWSDPDSATTKVELAWSEKKIAWDSTEGYDSKTITKRKSYNIDSDIEPGTTLYIRVRFLNDDETGSWSNAVGVLCATTPEKPVLEASKATVKPKGNLGLAWTYDNEDGSTLLRSVLFITYNGTTTRRGVSNGATQGTIWHNKWSSGSTVTIRVAVTSANGVTSEKSDPVTVRVLNAPSPSVALGSGSTWTVLPYVETDDGEGAVTNIRTLSAAPLSVRVLYGGANGTVTIRREGAYRVEHADGSVSRGADGERVAVGAYTGETAYVDFPGVDFDDGCLYRAEVEATNDAGSKTVVTEPFRVEWDDQADAPTATAASDGLTATITPTATDEDEMCDVYRITADGLQLVMANVAWGETVLDPYAPLDKHGATHRIVSRTTDGDEAWVDVDAGNGEAGIVVDWDNKQIVLPYDVTLNDSYSKSYTTTRHRGGTITGKWLEGVERSASWNSQVIKVDEPDKLVLLRDLAQWTGECYMRSPQGVGFPCNIDVSTAAEYANGSVGISLTAYRLDSDSWGGVYA